MRTAWRTPTASNQPQRRGLPVVAPNSSPSHHFWGHSTYFRLLVGETNDPDPLQNRPGAGGALRVHGRGAGLPFVKAQDRHPFDSVQGRPFDETQGRQLRHQVPN